MIRVVFDTSLMVAAARSRAGAIFALVNSLPSAHFQVCLSTALHMEWQAVLTRPEHRPNGRSAAAVIAGLVEFGEPAHWQPIYFRWRPFLPDASDNMVFEVALASGCRFIVTHNLRDFAGVEAHGIHAILPGDFLRSLPRP